MTSWKQLTGAFSCWRIHGAQKKVAMEPHINRSSEEIRVVNAHRVLDCDLSD